MSDLIWTPPEGMAIHVARAWREFFRKAQSGAAGYTATPEMYVILYKAQLGRCFICQVARGINPEDPKGKGAQRLGWDHNHTTGAVRGLLCTKGEWSCNRIVGRFRDNAEAWRRGARYLEMPPALVLSQVQRVLGDSASAEDKIRLATDILGVERDALERKVNRAKLMMGASSSAVIVDEAVDFHG